MPYAINDSQEQFKNMLEPASHLSSSHSLAKCCLNSLDPAEAAYHKLETSLPPLTWSNVGCEFEKAKFQLDLDRGQECLDLLSQSWVLNNLGPDRVARIAKRFDIDFLKERVALQKLLRRLEKGKRKGRTICQYSARPEFKFVAYLDQRTQANPIGINAKVLHNSALLRIMKWAYADNEIASLSLIEQFLLADEEEKYFNQYMLLHLANRFNFPTLRMKCLSSLRTIACVKGFMNNPDYRAHLSSVDRELMEKRLEMLREYGDAGEEVPDDEYHFDIHSGCYFDESIQARYLPALNRNWKPDNNNDDGCISGGFGDGEITGLDFDY